MIIIPLRILKYNHQNIAYKLLITVSSFPQYQKHKN